MANDTDPASYSTTSSAQDVAYEYKKSHEHASYYWLDNNTQAFAYHSFYDIFKDDMNLRDTLISIVKSSPELEMKKRIEEHQITLYQ